MNIFEQCQDIFGMIPESAFDANQWEALSCHLWNVEIGYEETENAQVLCDNFSEGASYLHPQERQEVLDAIAAMRNHLSSTEHKHNPGGGDVCQHRSNIVSAR